MKRRHFLGASLAVLASGLVSGTPAFARPKRKPNFIVILCDDLGYGDIEPTGGKMIKTPHLNRMAAEGTVLTDYYAPANICTPSRAGQLTGRYPIRTGLGYQVILQSDHRGLPLSEVTIPKLLKPAGYASMLVGKWHLGHLGAAWPPTKHGFDKFFGIPYSHDMLPLSLFTDSGGGAEVTKEPVEFSELQQRFAHRAEQFIEDNVHQPFFLELALSGPHVPNDPNSAFKGKSAADSYGDVVQEIDGIVGRLMAKLKALGIDQDTLIIFTSDNGAWYQGSTGGLRDRKGGAAYDGGYRVPFIAHMPGTVPAGKRVNSIAMGIDFLPTLCAMAGAPLPQGVTLDGKDISAVLTKGAPTPHEELLLFDNEDLVAVRTQHWKYVASTHYHGFLLPVNLHRPGLTDAYQLYDMSTRDISESYSVAVSHPDALADMQARFARAQSMFGPLKNPNSMKAFQEAMKPQPGDPPLGPSSFPKAIGQTQD